MPSGGVLRTSTSLTCGIQPQDYIHSPSWITPQGLVVDEMTTDPHFVLTNGGYLNRTTVTSGNYTCAIDSSYAGDPQRTARTEAAIELRLSGIVQELVNLMRVNSRLAAH